MGRIRTIKPEFPQSQSMGRVSRDARLLFVLLWTLADDSGRTCAASRMLASLLYPYDDDAPKLISGWLAELSSVGAIVLYSVEGDDYLEIRNWLKHQKIDKPSKSKFPAFDESSRALASPRESSSLDQGPRTKDQGSISSPNAPRSRVRELDPDALDHFERFWSAYGKKVGRAAAERAWGRLKVAERDAAVAGVPRYVEAQPDPKFRKDPERWLKHRCWLDEVAIGGATRGGVVPKSLPVGSYLTAGDDPVQTL